MRKDAAAAPFFIDHLMHDLKLERFTREPGDGPMKTFTLRGHQAKPPFPARRALPDT